MATSLADVTDARTTRIERALATSEDALRRQNEAIDRAEALQRRLDEKNQALQQEWDAAQGSSERRAAAERARAEVRDLQDQVKRTQADVDAGSQVIDVDVLAGVLDLLKNPYSDPSGYCACYTEKRNRLRTIEADISTVSNSLPGAMDDFKTAMSRWAAVVALWASAAALVIAAAVVWFLGWAVKFFWALVIAALIAMAIAVTLFLLALRAHKRVIELRKQLLQLALDHYRLERISTCRRGPG